MTPWATYRLQLHPGFTFDHAAQVVPYLARLGVTHLYLSPSLQAVPGSSHGYDVVDPAHLSEQLGGDEGFERLWSAAAAAELGLVLDIVPNHLGLVPTANRWWWDVLQHGPGSVYAEYFDIDWDRHGDGRVVLPDLGGPLDEILAADELRIVEEDGERRLAYHEHRWPLRRGTPDTDDLREVVEAQHYRLVHWRRANEELNYRRFFDVTLLGGVRVEEPRVFDDVHGRVLALVEAGKVAGLRVDHPDGLWDPTGYAQQLRAAAPDAWIVFEKILEDGERPRDEWPVDGTVGYEFLNLVLGQFVDPASEPAFTDLYGEVVGQAPGYDEIVTTAKHEAVRNLLVSEHRRLVSLVAAAGASTDGPKPPPREALATALEEVLVAHPVYRTYVRPSEGTVGGVDAGVITHTVGAARAAASGDGMVLAAIDLIERVWRLERRSDAGDEFVMRLQQLTGPVMAKGVEDTTFYRYLRFTALNEVGGDPSQFGRTLERWHAANVLRNTDWPATMLTTSTHDTKRSEDVRARLAAASEFSGEWRAAFERFRVATSRLVGPDGPSPNHVYLAFQTAIGAWPISADRLATYLHKAAREEKRSTSWLDPDERYEQQLQAFATAVVEDPSVAAVVADFAELVRDAGRVVSLAQTLLKLTSPGVPDVYQGTEVWDLSLVDPDNRRPVDFDELHEGLTQVTAARNEGVVDLERIRAGDDRGLPKLWVTARTLDIRRAHAAAFEPGAAYRPLLADGPRSDDVIAFVRGEVGEQVVTVAPRRVREHRWGDTTLPLPVGSWYDVLSGASHDGGIASMSDLLRRFPVALLVASPTTP